MEKPKKKQGKYGPLLAELKEFIVRRKLYWLAPILFILAIMGAFIVLTEGSALLPFIYAGF